MAGEIPTGLRDYLADRYTLERLIARGGMASVYLGRDIRHDRAVAVKVLRPELGALLGAERFLREIKVVARLQHPHILPLYDSGEADDTLYYVMPFVSGDSLRDRIRREQRLSIRAALRITREVADALYYAHSNDIVHRDIKPENILLSGDHAMVTDFGIARAVHVAGGERWETLTDSGVALGTPAYMSPEQTAGEHDIDGRSDIFSLGCVVYEMLAGVPPFAGPDGEVMIARRFTDPAPVLRAVRDDVAESVDLAVQRALARDPLERFTNARDFTDAIWDDTGAALRRGIAAGPGPTGAMPDADPPSRAHTTSRRSAAGAVTAREHQPWKVGGLAAVGIAVVAGMATVGTLLIVKPHAPRPRIDGRAAAVANGAADTSVRSGDAAAGTAKGATSGAATGLATGAAVGADSAANTGAARDMASGAVSNAGRAAADAGESAVPRDRAATSSAAATGRTVPERVKSEPQVRVPMPVPVPVSPRNDSVFASLHAAARAARTHAVGEGANATELFRGDSLERAAEVSAAAGRVSDAMAQLVGASNAWAEGARSATARTATVHAARDSEIVADRPATAPATTTTPATTPATDRAAIEALLARYESAIEARDIPAIRALYPGMTAAQQSDWRQFFGTVQNVRATLAIAQLDLAGSTADLRVTGSYRYENTSTRRSEEQPISFRASLVRDGANWRISAIK